MFSSYIIVPLAFVALASAQVTGQLGNAVVASGEPIGASYQAVLPNSNSTSIRGQITGTTNANGTGVSWNVNFYGFPDEATFGPFSKSPRKRHSNFADRYSPVYHIHAFPVPSDGNCTGTLAHLDPFVRGESPPCDATNPVTCQVGDLSGKHGNVTTSPFQASYVDLYTSTLPGVGSFFGNRSIVIHSTNTTRLTCANFTMVAGNSTLPSMTTPQPAQYTGGAVAKVLSGGAALAGLMAFLL